MEQPESHGEWTDAAGTGERRANIAEMEVTGPTLTWLELAEPQQPVPIGENDRVLDSTYNEEHDVWEILLVALPDDEE